MPPFTRRPSGSLGRVLSLLLSFMACAAPRATHSKPKQQEALPLPRAFNPTSLDDIPYFPAWVRRFDLSVAARRPPSFSPASRRKCGRSAQLARQQALRPAAPSYQAPSPRLRRAVWPDLSLPQPLSGDFQHALQQGVIAAAKHTDGNLDLTVLTAAHGFGGRFGCATAQGVWRILGADLPFTCVAYLAGSTQLGASTTQDAAPYRGQDWALVRLRRSVGIGGTGLTSALQALQSTVLPVRPRLPDDDTPVRILGAFYPYQEALVSDGVLSREFYDDPVAPLGTHLRLKPNFVAPASSYGVMPLGLHAPVAWPGLSGSPVLSGATPDEQPSLLGLVTEGEALLSADEDGACLEYVLAQVDRFGALAAFLTQPRGLAPLGDLSTLYTAVDESTLGQAQVGVAPENALRIGYQLDLCFETSDMATHATPTLQFEVAGETVLQRTLSLAAHARHFGGQASCEGLTWQHFVATEATEQAEPFTLKLSWQDAPELRVYGAVGQVLHMPEAT